MLDRDSASDRNGLSNYMTVARLRCPMPCDHLLKIKQKEKYLTMLGDRLDSSNYIYGYNDIGHIIILKLFFKKISLNIVHLNEVAFSLA